MLFIAADQLAFLDDAMAARLLDTSQMAGAFQLLRSNDLFWSRLIPSICWAAASIPST